MQKRKKKDHTVAAGICYKRYIEHTTCADIKNYRGSERRYRYQKQNIRGSLSAAKTEATRDEKILKKLPQERYFVTRTLARFAHAVSQVSRTYKHTHTRARTHAHTVVLYVTAHNELKKM